MCMCVCVFMGPCVCACACVFVRVRVYLCVCVCVCCVVSALSTSLSISFSTWCYEHCRGSWRSSRPVAHLLFLTPAQVLGALELVVIPSLGALRGEGEETCLGQEAGVSYEFGGRPSEHKRKQSHSNFHTYCWVL